MSATGTGSALAASGAPDYLTEDDKRRKKKLRRFRRMTAHQKRAFVQYERRHNEKDGRLYYCDYCDLFVSSSPKCWKKHLRSVRHMDAVEGYYEMATQIEAAWFLKIQGGIDRAWARVVHQRQQEVAGTGAVTPLPATMVSPGIVVGGTAPLPPPEAMSIKVGNTVVYNGKQ